MSYPQREMSAGSRKRVRDEDDEFDVEILGFGIENFEEYVEKCLEDLNAANPPADAHGVGIGATSAASQQTPTAPHSTHTGTASADFTFSDLLSTQQSGQTRGTAPARPAFFEGNNGTQSAIPRIQPMNSNIGSYERFEGQGFNPRPPQSMNSDGFTGHSFAGAHTPTSAGVRQRAAQRQRAPAAGSAYRGYNQPLSGVNGQQLPGNGGHPAHARYRVSGQSHLQGQRLGASNTVPSQPYPQGQPHQASTAAQASAYQATRPDLEWYNKTAHQLANPYHYLPRIPVRSTLPATGRLLYPYEVLKCRYMHPEERYRKYVDYSNTLLALYGGQPNADALKSRVVRISDYHRATEGWYMREVRQEQFGDLQTFKEGCDQELQLAQFNLGPADYPTPLISPAAGNSRLTNMFSQQAPAGPQNGHSSAVPPQGSFGVSAPPSSGYSVPAAPAVRQPYSQPVTMGYQAPATALAPAVAAGQKQRSSVPDHQQGRFAYGSTSSAPILIDDDNNEEPAEFTSGYYQAPAGLNPGVKRRRPEEQVGSSKMARTDSYDMPFDLTKDKDEAFDREVLNPGVKRTHPYEPDRSSKMARTSAYTKPIDLTDGGYTLAPLPSTQAPSASTGAAAPPRQSFANTKKMKRFEIFKAAWDQDKQRVDSVGKRVGHLPTHLLQRVNKGEFNFKTAWEAFVGKFAIKQRDIDEARREDQAIEERKERQRENKKKKKAEKAKAEEEEEEEQQDEEEDEEEAKAKKKAAARQRWNDAQKARQEQRRLDREEAARKEAEEEAEKARAQEEQDLLDMLTVGLEKEQDLLDMFTAGLEEETDETEAVPAGDEGEHTSLTGVLTEATSPGEENDDDMASLFGDFEEIPISLSNFATKATSSEDADGGDLNSLFDDEEDATDTPVTSPEEGNVANKDDMDSLFGDNEDAIDMPVTSPEDNVANKDVPNATTGEESVEEDANSSVEEDVDPTIEAIQAQMRVLDGEIAQKSIQLANTTNKLFKGRVQTAIDELLEKKRTLENEIARMVEAKKMAEIEEEGGL